MTPYRYACVFGHLVRWLICLAVSINYEQEILVERERAYIVTVRGRLQENA